MTPALGTLRQEDLAFEASVGYIVIPSLNINIYGVQKSMNLGHIFRGVLQGEIVLESPQICLARTTFKELEEIMFSILNKIISLVKQWRTINIRDRSCLN